MLLLTFKIGGTLEYKEIDGDFTSPGYTPPCPECNKTRTFFSMMLYPIFKESSWLCTDCGHHFALYKSKELMQAELDEINLILEQLKDNQ